MKIKIITVGKTRKNHWQLAEQDYLKRIQRYCELQFVFTKEASQETLRNDALVKETEAVEIKKKIEAGEFVIALDQRGKTLSSEELAEFLQDKTVQGRSRFCFIIGGPLGLSPEICQQADLVLALSKMTLPHELAKIVLLEQIYRAFTIMHGEKYHK